jgi:uncharacterized protein YneF (UPF0154 family)
MSPQLVLWLLGVGIVLGVGMLLGRFMRRRQREHMQRLKGELRAPPPRERGLTMALPTVRKVLARLVKAAGYAG